MKLYRGPASKDFDDETHQLVATHQFPTDRKAWANRTAVRLNASKEAIERQSVAHVVLEQEDVLALHEGLMAGLVEKARHADALKLQNMRLRAALAKVQEKLKKANPEDFDKLASELAGIVGKALGKGK